MKSKYKKQRFQPDAYHTQKTLKVAFPSGLQPPWFYRQTALFSPNCIAGFLIWGKWNLFGSLLYPAKGP